jgi:hypothetical protein
MITWCILLFSLLSLTFAVQEQQSSLYSILFDDDNSKIESNNEEGWLSTNDDEYIDESKSHRAAYQHEQDLLANIYSPNRTYISMHDDRIHPTNFSYFTFNSPGTYRFILISSRGDADLYVSTRDKHVSYDNYEYSSCTCGIDEIFIDSYVKLPIYIGIYGHSQYQISHYRLLIELIDTKLPSSEIPIEQSNDDQSTAQTSRIDKKTSRVVGEGKDEKQHLLWNVLLWILNFLVEVLT